MLNTQGPFLPINHDTFLNTLRVLREVRRTKRRFSLANWMLGWEGKHGEFVDETGCGTIACVAGWCTMDEWFQTTHGMRMLAMGPNADEVRMGAIVQPVRGNFRHDPMRLLMQVWGINRPAAEALFMPDGYAKRRGGINHVIAKFERALATYRVSNSGQKIVIDIRQPNPHYATT